MLTYKFDEFVATEITKLYFKKYITIDEYPGSNPSCDTITFKLGLPTPPLNYNVEILTFGYGQFLKEFNYQPELHKITCPTLLLWTAEDFLFDLRQAKILQTEIAHSKLVALEHCGHIFWTDCWEGFIDETINFINDPDSNTLEMVENTAR